MAEVTKLAFRLGVTAFGGPAAHIAMLRQEVVVHRKWLSPQEFLDLLGATNLIPGPNSTEMVMHVGHVRAGRRGLVAAGAAFILPAALITLIIAWLYVRYGTTPEGDWLLYGIKPVIIAIVAQALWGLARTALKDVAALTVASGVIALYLLGLNEILLLFGGGVLLFGFRKLRSGLDSNRAVGVAIAPVVISKLISIANVSTDAVAYTHLRLFLTFLKIGSLLYGSGYVLLAFLRNDFVVRFGWLTEKQLLDAVAVGQVTPGPVFTTATFVGYIAGGFGGAVLATIAIFLPAFLFVGLTHPLIKRMRSHASLGLLLDGVNVAAVGLMTAVSLLLTSDAIIDAPTAMIAGLSWVLLVKWRVNATWLIAAGGAIGLLRWWLG